MKPRQVVGALILAVLVVFVAFNLDRAEIWAFGARIEMPIALVVIFSAALGALSMYFFNVLRSGSKSPSNGGERDRA